MKPKLTILEKEPLQITICKNGRPVSKASALGTLKKHYPHVSQDNWEIEIVSHSTRVKLKGE